MKTILAKYKFQIGAKIVFHPHHTGSDQDGVQLTQWGAAGGPYYEKAMSERPVSLTNITKPDSRELTMARSMCWHCQSEVSGEYFCGRCVKVQPLSKELDYFTCLNLPRKLVIDGKELEETFYAMSRSFHPDFFSNKDESEQVVSLGNTALLNTAYRT